MIDLHLRATTEAMMAVALSDYDLFDPSMDGGWVTTGPGWSLVPLGALVITPATYDDSGNLLTAPVIDPAFHLNIRLSDADHPLIPALQDTGLLITVNTPRVGWA